MTQPSGDASGERAANSPAGAPDGVGSRPREESTEPELDPNDPYRYGRPDPDPALLRFGPAPGAQSGARSGPGPFGAQPPPSDPWAGYQNPPYQQSPGYPGYPQQPGQPPPPPPYTRYPQPGDRNGLAVAGLVLGLVGLFLFWLPVVGAVLGVLGIVFGVLGLRAARAGAAAAYGAGRGRGTGHGLALAGVICGSVATVLCIVWSVYFFSKVHDCAQYGVGTSSYNLCLQQ